MRQLLLLAVIALTACYDSRFGEPEGGHTSPTNLTLAQLRALYAGSPFEIVSDVTLSGIVTTSDRDENFYRTFCIQEQGAGIEIQAGVDHLHNDYPIGCRVSVNLKGLSVAESYGMLQAGRSPAPGSGFAVDYIGSTKAALDAHVVRSSGPITELAPTVYEIEGLAGGMCGTLVRIDRLRYSPEELASGSWAGYKRFTDTKGHEIDAYVRSYASFAGDDVPPGEVSLVGILQRDAKGDGRWIVKLRDETDCIY